MMVILGQVGTNDHGITPNTDHIFPADRCVWSQQVGVGGDGYQIGTVFFFPGAGTTGAATIVTEARLGYIGKSGRFVEIAS